MRTASFVTSLIAAIFSALHAGAQSWDSVPADLGTGGGICAESRGTTACLAFVCKQAPARGLNFVVLRNRATAASPEKAELKVDNHRPVILHLRRVDSVRGQIANLDRGGDNSNLLLDLADGAVVHLRLEDEYTLPLRGARAQIERAIRACDTKDFSLKSLAELREDVAERDAPSPTQTALTYLYRTDSWGNDLDGGLTNPALKNITPEACTEACLNRPDCNAVTYNKPATVCFLKSSLGSLRLDARATTTVIAKRPTEVRRPLLPGPLPRLVPELRATAGQSEGQFIRALRSAAQHLGEDCRQEVNAVARAASTLRLVPPSDLRVGVPASLTWRIDPMSVRVPAWIIVSVDRPIRFQGDGFFALHPGSVGPFGVTADEDRQRAFVPLYEGLSALKGSLAIEALTAGTHEIRVTMLTYLRACEEERALMRNSFSLNAAPGEAEILLRDLTEPVPFDRLVNVPTFDRRVVFNTTRLQIQHLSDGSEIVTREGKGLTISPTGRYIALEDDGRFEVVDIVDGASLGTFLGSALAYWNADSFLLTEVGSHGRVSVASTLRPRVYVNDMQTGASCCFNGGSTVLAADLENTMLRVAGQAWDLLDGSSIGSTEQPDLYDDREFLLSKTVAPHAYDQIGTVAPISVAEAWSMPKGPNYVAGLTFRNVRKRTDPEDAAVAAMAREGVAAERNPAFGRAPTSVAVADGGATFLRGLTSEEATTAPKGFAAALSRWGITLADYVDPERTLATADFQKMWRGGIEPGPEFTRTVTRIEFDLEAQGVKPNWAKPTETNDDGYCAHFATVGKDTSLPSAPYHLNQADRFNLGNRVIWTLRARCDGGATGGSLMHATAVTIYDSANSVKALGEHVVDLEWSYFGRRHQLLFDTDFRSRIFADRLLVTYAPGAGAITVFDLNRRMFIMKTEYGRRGDLLSSVFIDTTLKHLIQINTDGSFTLYDLSDGGAPVLDGRYLDDELVVWNENFLFDATEEGAAFVDLRFPGRSGQFSLQQFGRALRHDGLLQDVLAGKNLEDPPVPRVPPELSASIRLDNERIFVSPTVNSDAEIVALRLFQEGLLTRTVAADATFQPFTVDRMPGARWVSLVAEDVNGLLSIPVSEDLGPDDRGQAATHFLGVGIDYYTAADLQSLNFAKTDVIRVLSALEAGENGLASREVLVDRRATAPVILETLDRIITAANPSDHLVLFVAGHGLLSEDGRFFIGLSQTDTDDLSATALDWNEVAQRLRGAGLRVTVLLDACHAGAVQSQAFASSNDVGLSVADTLASAMTVISAAKGRQYSGESSKVGGGFFSAAIANVLIKNRAAYDQNSNGRLEVIEFYRGVKREVVSYRGADQTPWLIRNQLVGEYALF